MAIHMTSYDIQKACRLVAETYYGSQGIWLCNAFEAINRAYFANELPYPHLTIEITAHARCIAWCELSERPPRIAIHPTLFGFREKENPWGYPTEWLGPPLAFDSLLHECLHVSVHYRLGGAHGPTSHNNSQWVTEVNRLAPLLGFQDIKAARQVATRVAVDRELTQQGKAKTKVVKVCDGNVPFRAVATFPRGLREHLGTAAEYYTAGKLPLVF
jgi:hypothetical protein